jgi:polyferredoxin
MSDKKRKDFVCATADIIYDFNWKVAIILFFLYIFISSDIYNNYILVLFDGALDGGIPTSYGIIIQALTFVILFMFIDLFEKNKII